MSFFACRPKLKRSTVQRWQREYDGADRFNEQRKRCKLNNKQHTTAFNKRVAKRRARKGYGV